jgi:hypothetical protein
MVLYKEPFVQQQKLQLVTTKILLLATQKKLFVFHYIVIKINTHFYTTQSWSLHLNLLLCYYEQYLQHSHI